MILEHTAIWCSDLETMKDFYVQFLDGISNEKYVNEAKRYESYFISFGAGARLELMSKPNLPDNLNDTLTTQHKGIIHLAFETATRQEVAEKALLFAANGFRILDGPRVTGDGYFEFVTHDPENNRIEITTANWD
jgi:lactoylglutathione lyase